MQLEKCPECVRVFAMQGNAKHAPGTLHIIGLTIKFSESQQWSKGLSQVCGARISHFVINSPIIHNNRVSGVTRFDLVETPAESSLHP